MIIKSMTRKEPSFDTLLKYLHRGRIDARFQFYHNLYSRKNESIEREFLENAVHLRKRQGGVYLYHEILSITKSTRISEFRQKEILQEIAQQYVLSRSHRSLVYGVLHDEHRGHLHYHLMISGNEVGSPERTRISRGAFAEIKKQLEDWVLERFPELEQTRIMDKAASGEKLSRAGGELKRRTGKMPERDDLKERLKTIFQMAWDKADFFRLLAAKQVKIYVRGESIGFEDLKTGRKHQLKTLGLEAEFAAVNARISEHQSQQQTETQGQAQTQTQTQKQEKTQNQNHNQTRKKDPAYPTQTPSTPSGLSEDAIQQARERLEAESCEQAAREALRAAQAERERVEARQEEERRRSAQKAENEAKETGQNPPWGGREEKPTSAQQDDGDKEENRTGQTTVEAERIQATIDRRRQEAEQLRTGKEQRREADRFQKR